MLSYIEISKKNLIHNFQAFRNFLNEQTKIVAVIKANAYGHGQNEVAEILENYADYFQVDDAQEIKLLRKVTTKPILVLGYVAREELSSVIKLDGIMGVYDKSQILAIDSIAKGLNKKALVHIKIDAFLGRQGVLIENVWEIIEVLRDCKNLKVDGVYSHFANIEDTSDFSHAQKQINCFLEAVKIFENNGFCNLNTHISASSGIMVYEKNEHKSKLARAGIGIYGMWPSQELQEKIENDQFQLKPVMRWVSHVAQVKTVPQGYSIGYGLTFVTDKPTKIAIIPQGYSDGYDRGLSNSGEVLIQGVRCRVLGRVAMNMFVVDVSHLEQVEAEEEVVLLGEQGSAMISAEEIAAKLGTINYEITTRISPLLKRIIVE